MPASEDEQAMQAVIDNMGEAARAFKAKRYAPKPAPASEAPTDEAPEESSDVSEMPSADELASLLGK